MFATTILQNPVHIDHHMPTHAYGMWFTGRLDRKIEFPIPNEEARARILQIHARKMNVSKDVNFEELSQCTEDFNGAQCKAVCVEAVRHQLQINTHQPSVYTTSVPLPPSVPFQSFLPPSFSLLPIPVLGDDCSAKRRG